MTQGMQAKPPERNNFSNLSISRGVLFGAILLTALLAFEIFNYGTTDYALTDLLGDLKFMGLRWATILAIAFCGIDFAGIARLFAPELGRQQNENWYLFAAWLLAATMNASLTWWGVSLAVLNHQTQGGAVIAQETMVRVAPVFVAVLVWLIRVLIIGTFSINGDQFFQSSAALGRSAPVYRSTPVYRPGAQSTAAYRPMASRSSGAPAPAMTARSRELAETVAGSEPLPAAAQAATPQPVPHTFSTPRRYSPPPEPRYEDADEENSASSIEPVYTRAPLAARPAKGGPGNSGPASPGRRF